MEIKDQSIETATDAEGNEYITEIETTMTETSADGTVSVAEMTTTANPDDPTDVEGQMTVTETAPDGTETVTEYVANEEGVFKVEEEGVFEQAVEAILGVEIEDNLTQVMDANGNPVGEAVAGSDVYVAEPDDTTDDFTDGQEMFETDFETIEISDPLVSDESFNPTIETVDPAFIETPSFDSTIAENETYDASFDPNFGISDAGSTDFSNETALSEEENQEISEQQAHAEAATEAQQAADEFVEKGDYAAAAEAREIAEIEAGEADDVSMLGVYDAQDLEFAAEKQEDAEYYQQQEAMHAQEGDYEAAREDAINAGYATADADSLAGGEDHTGQADSEVANMDNALWHEGLAEDRIDDAVYHAEMGNEDAAESALAAAGYEQETADDYGDRGEHGSIMADYDPSSVVETGGTYESSYEDNLADVDTGFDTNIDTGYDAGMEMSVDTGFDSGLDTGVDTGYDPGSSDV